MKKIIIDKELFDFADAFSKRSKKTASDPFGNMFISSGDKYKIKYYDLLRDQCDQVTLTPARVGSDTMVIELSKERLQEAHDDVVFYFIIYCYILYWVYQEKLSHTQKYILADKLAIEYYIKKKKNTKEILLYYLRMDKESTLIDFWKDRIRVIEKTLMQKTNGRKKKVD